MADDNNTKLKKILLDDLVKNCSHRCSDDFEKSYHMHNFHVANSFLVSHGYIDRPAIRQKKPDFVVDFGYQTIPGSVDEIEIRSIFSKGSIVFEFLWSLFWDDGAKKSENISIGRTANNDIVLPDKRVSKAHGFFFLKGNRVYYVDDSRYGTTLNRAKLSKGEKTFVPSKAELGIGPFTFNLFAPKDLYRIIDILKR